MNVLIIGYVWPEPKSSAAGSNMLSLIKLFRQQDWQVTFASPAELSMHMADLAMLNVPTQSIALNDSSFDQYISELAPDIVVFDRYMMEEQFAWRVEKNCPSALRILQSEDLHFLRQARHKALKQHRDIQQEDWHSDYAKREIAAILRCDLTFIISSAEMKLLQEQFNIDPALLQHAPFMVENISSNEIDTLPTFEQRTDFISIGSFRHEPNWDAVLWLYKEIWPKIRKRLPQASIRVCGSYPPKKATQLHNPKIGFYVKGWVEDAQHEMQQARVCLAPLRFGAGLKGKLIDAMQAGTPNVTSTIGVEAMSCIPRLEYSSESRVSVDGGEATLTDEAKNTLPWSGYIEDDVDSFVEQAVALYSDSTAWQQAQQNGFQIINQIYDAEVIGKALIDRINNVLQHLGQHRLNNFTGAMLRHHSLKSTQYMSQWIEEKNKHKVEPES